MQANYPFIKTSCECCHSCFVDVRTSECVYGGMFAGYKNTEGRPIDLGALLLRRSKQPEREKD